MTISQRSVRLGISVNVLANRWQKNNVINNKIISNQKYILTNQWKKDKKTLHIDQVVIFSCWDLYISHLILYFFNFYFFKEVHGSGDKWFIQSSIITENDIESNLQFVFSGIKVSRGSLHYLWLEHTSFVSLPSSKVRTMKFQNLSPHMLTHSLPATHTHEHTHEHTSLGLLLNSSCAKPWLQPVFLGIVTVLKSRIIRS